MTTEFKTKKSRETYERVLNTAIQLFARDGFKSVTMRDISRESNLGLGALYYYFPSKESIVQSFYQKVSQSVADRFESAIEDVTDLADGFTIYMTEKFNQLAPYRDLLVVIMKEAIDPASPLSPFSPDSSDPLEQNLSQFKTLVERTTQRSDTEATELARLLWMAHLLILMFWLHDRSPDHQATQRILDLSGMGMRFLPTIGSQPGMAAVLQPFLSSLGGLFPEGKS